MRSGTVGYLISVLDAKRRLDGPQTHRTSVTAGTDMVSWTSVLTDRQMQS